jgi:hypothetical protein
MNTRGQYEKNRADCGRMQEEVYHEIHLQKKFSDGNYAKRACVLIISYRNARKA